MGIYWSIKYFKRLFSLMAILLMCPLKSLGFSLMPIQWSLKTGSVTPCIYYARTKVNLYFTLYTLIFFGKQDNLSRFILLILIHLLWPCQCRVSEGTFTLPSLRTVLDSLPSHGSSYLTLLFKLFIFYFKIHFRWYGMNPFAQWENNVLS